VFCTQEATTHKASPSPQPQSPACSCAVCLGCHRDRWSQEIKLAFLNFCFLRFPTFRNCFKWVGAVPRGCQSPSIASKYKRGTAAVEAIHTCAAAAYRLRVPDHLGAVLRVNIPTTIASKLLGPLPMSADNLRISTAVPQERGMLNKQKGACMPLLHTIHMYIELHIVCTASTGKFLRGCPTKRPPGQPPTPKCHREAILEDMLLPDAADRCSSW
jgi:hypothetical protein